MKKLQETLRLACRSERMVLSIWKHNFVCCMPETKSNVITLAYLTMVNEKNSRVLVITVKIKNIASIHFKEFCLYVKKSNTGLYSHSQIGYACT